MWSCRCHVTCMLVNENSARNDKSTSKPFLNAQTGITTQKGWITACYWYVFMTNVCASWITEFTCYVENI